MRLLIIRLLTTPLIIICGEQMTCEHLLTNEQRSFAEQPVYN
jgi:hypothetical protein